MKRPLFVDTNYLCAFYNKSDSLHEKAKKSSSSLGEFHIVISNFILLESYTVLSQRVSKNHVLTFKEDMYNEKYYRIYWVDKNLEENIWLIFKSIKDKNFSYVDASILAVMKKEKINHLLSFDATFKNLQEQFKFKLIGS
jgi:predicted nucleic acid-binding protein